MTTEPLRVLLANAGFAPDYHWFFTPPLGIITAGDPCAGDATVQGVFP
jgi:hypothetical protein